MEKHLLEKLSETTAEEFNILNGMPFDPNLYFESKTLIKSTKLLASDKAEIGIKKHPRFAAFPEHEHNFIEMMIVLSGSITHRINGCTAELKSGDVLIMNKHIRHSIEKASDSDLGINIIMTNGFVSALSAELADTVFEAFLKDNSKPCGTGAFLHFSTDGKKQAENLIENIIFELTEPKINTAILARTIAVLFSYLSSKRELLVFASLPMSTESERKFVISDYIKNNYRHAFLSELGEKLFLSLPYLSKLIATYFGKSFKELLLEERLTRADKLVRETDMPISELIRSVGYENISYFHKEYKSRFGTTPLLRRKESKLRQNQSP